MAAYVRSAGRLAVIFLIGAVMTGCAGTPAWVRSPPEDPRFFYTVGIRSGAPSLEAGRRQAVSNAVRQLVERFGVEASAEYQEVKTRLETRVLDALETRSGGVELEDHLVVRWDYDARQDEGRTVYDVYVLVRYPKAAWRRERARVAQMAQDRRRRLEHGLREAREAGRSGNLQGAASGFVRVYQAAQEEEPALARRALDELGSMLARVRLERVSGDGQTGVIPEGPPDPFVVRASLYPVTRGESVPLEAMPVAFHLVEPHRELLTRVSTNARGLAPWRISDLAKPSEKYRVQASLDIRPLETLLDPLPDEAIRELRPALTLLQQRAATFRFRAITVERDVSVLLVVQERNHGRTSRLVASSIAGRLRDAGYQVLSSWADQRPEWLVIGHVRAGSSRQSLPTVHASLAEADITVVERESGKALEQFHVEAVGYGSSELLAGRRALAGASNILSSKLVRHLVALSPSHLVPTGHKEDLR